MARFKLFSPISSCGEPLNGPNACFCKVFCRYANYGEPMPNPYADGGEFLRVGEKGVWPTRRQPPVEVKFERAKMLEKSKEIFLFMAFSIIFACFFMPFHGFRGVLQCFECI